MEMKVFSIYDMKTEVYSKPFFCLTTGEAIRTFTDAVNEPNSPFNRHPEDFNLFEIGVFDDGAAVIKGDVPLSLGCALQFIIEPDYRVTAEGQSAVRGNGQGAGVNSPGER